MATAIFTYGYWTFLRVQTWGDMASHIDYAEGIESFADLTSPHFPGLFALADVIRRRWRQVLMFAVAIALPATLVLLWQALRTYGPNPGTGVIFAPFAVFDFHATLYKLPASLAFPIVVVGVAMRGGVRDPKFTFAWVFTAVAMFFTLLVGEAGPRLGEGNFAWTGQTAVFLLYVESLLLLVVRPDLSRWRPAAWAAFAVHVLCGVVWYAAVFSRDWSRWL